MKTIISPHRVKAIMRETDITLFDASHERRFRDTLALHHLFVNIDLASPTTDPPASTASTASIEYDTIETPFGSVAIAATKKGICDLFFIPTQAAALDYLKAKYATKKITNQASQYSPILSAILSNQANCQFHIPLDIQSTCFQRKVWQNLLRIPRGGLTSYKKIAEHIGHAKAARAVGTAIAQNPIAFLIPCHRVVPRSGDIGGYRWGTSRKADMIAWEVSGFS